MKEFCSETLSRRHTHGSAANRTHFYGSGI